MGGRAGPGQGGATRTESDRVQAGRAGAVRGRPAGTKARWLVWLGLLLFIVGFAMFAAADLNFIKQIASDIQSNAAPAPPTDLFGRPIFGIPSGLLGWAIAAIGALMLVIGIVLHIVATSRRKRVDRDYPMPMPWPPNGAQGRAR